MIEIDVSMPKCCDECFALDDNGDYPFCLISKDQRGYTFNVYENRMPSCPLRAQKPVEPRRAGFPDASRAYGSWYYVCGACSAPIDPKDNYCRFCGRRVKWDD